MRVIGLVNLLSKAQWENKKVYFPKMYSFNKTCNFSNVATTVRARKSNLFQFDTILLYPCSGHLCCSWCNTCQHMQALGDRGKTMYYLEWCWASLITRWMRVNVAGCGNMMWNRSESSWTTTLIRQQKQNPEQMSSVALIHPMTTLCAAGRCSHSPSSLTSILKIMRTVSTGKESNN